MSINASVGRRPKPEGERLSVFFPGFRCTPKEFAKIQKAAEKARQRPTTWAREKLLEAAGAVDEDPAAELRRLKERIQKLLGS